MRSYLLLISIFVMLPVCVLKPYIGGLMWVWIGLMNPHRLTWGIAYSFPVAQIIAIVTLIGFMITPEKDKFPKGRETLLLICLVIWFTITTMYALAPDDSWKKWYLIVKVFLMTFVIIFLFQERKKLKYLVTTIAISIGYYGVKGGIFGILSNGEYQVLGPSDSFIADNNALALAELIVIPLLICLYKETDNKCMKMLYLVSVPLTFFSIVFSYSRGALLGLITFMILLILNSKKKVLLLPVCIGAILLALPLLPQRWVARMETIQTYQEDDSAMARINSWNFAYRLALDRPLLGGGFEAFQKDIFAIYAPKPNLVFAAHSIYFEVLGEHGFIGLGLYLCLILSSLYSLRWLKRQSENTPSLQWMKNYVQMTQISLICYLVSGSFLGLAYFDLFYYIVALIILMKCIVKKELQQNLIVLRDTAAPKHKERVAWYRKAPTL